ncbi:ubiquitin-like domain-containing protein [Actinomadura sp. ATCC 31491]|uniref:Ubiquitin-like domain-containing protein n=1 Tax=Actinomadura luzonensis TaxID=2805427 RepID=A0ABT0FLU0_9ACTN|nr:resuscitation-promoting factor [Actinomadura luzonensis]MCK2213247.1 ubiquitin-like domain-containing protein [Actinomadura luzonensis]
MRGRRRKPRPPIPWRSPWTPVVCLAGGLAVAAIVVASSMAKDVVVVVDGRQTALRSFAGSVRDALGEAGISVGVGDVVRPPVHQALADGDTIEVRRARPIRLTLDGRTSEHLVTSTDVAGALAELAIPPTAGKVSAPRDEAVPLSGMALTVYTRRKVYVVAGATRRASRTTARTVREVLRQQHVELGRGYQVQPPLGSFPEDGMVITVTPPRADEIEPEVAALNWRALAECESRADPEAYNAEGPYYGMYLFSLPMWKAVGGQGLPTDWPEEEQTYRAQLLYQQVEGRWQGQWPACGADLFG